MRNKSFQFILIIICFVGSHLMQAQAPQQFKYQGIARDVSGVPLPLQNISVKAGIYSGSATGTLEWEETQNTTTDTFGLYVYPIGTGVSTGTGALAGFNLIQWQTTNFYLKISIDYFGSTSYISMGTAQLFSVPYSFYSNQAANLSYSLNDFADADTAGIATGYILKWNGVNWIPAIDNHHDTVSFSYTAANALYSDTSNYANSFNYTADTVSYSYYSDSSGYSPISGSSLTSFTSSYSDTADYAYNFQSANWTTAGNTPTSTQFLGTSNSQDLIFKTNSTEKMRFLSSGNLSVGNVTPLAFIHFKGNDGFLSEGNDTIGNSIDSVFSSKLMWFPKKSALRLGQVTHYDSIGYYSISCGLNNKASGIYSGAFGLNSTAKSINCFAFGNNCYSAVDAGLVSYGGCIAMGEYNTVTRTRSTVMGSHNHSDGGMAFGANNYTSPGSYNQVFGENNNNNGGWSINFGRNTSNNAHIGCFIFSDTSTSIVSNTADNQFMARASGGFVFYSDSLLTNGVQLFSGGGSWASVSDRNKKTNFVSENEDEILSGILKLEITKWNYISQKKKVKHIGPMAQNFYSIFNIGENNTSINTVDIDGVCLLGIKALEKQTSEISEKLNQLNEVRAEIKSTENDFDSLENRLTKIEKTHNKK